jgi:hypothetical protein
MPRASIVFEAVRKARREPSFIITGVGAIVVVVTSIVGSGFNPLAIPFALWSLLPYAVIFLVGRWMENPWPAAGASLAALATELGVRASVFVWPRGSTAAIILVFSPVYILAIAVPLGAALGWVAGKAWRRHLAGRALVVLGAPVAFSLVVLAFARPELFPSTVMRRRALLERIGPPRVVVGAGTFESTPVSDSPKWSFARDLTGDARDELVLVDHRGATLLDPQTLVTVGEIAFADQSGRLWGSFATLVRLPDGRGAVAQTGGGFSKTLLQGLDGKVLWEYRPDPDSSPDSLDPADLDRDGVVEFYAASLDAIARLDPGGGEVWKRPTQLADLAAVLPQDNGRPAWVVGYEYGRRSVVFTENGQMLGERKVDAGLTVTAADYAGRRSLILGDRSVRGYGLDGSLHFDVTLGEFTAAQVVGVRLRPGEVASLAIVGATDRDTQRWRLLIMDPKTQVIYDEMADVYPRIFAARGLDADLLFVVSGNRLRRLSPVTR